MSKGSHKKRTVTALKWNLLDKLVSQGAGFVINLILARLLLPEDFGLIGMVIVITGFAAVFSDFGLGSAIIQKKELTARDLDSVFWTNLLVGILLTAIVFFSAGPIAGFYGISSLKPITQLLSLTYFISSINTVQLALLRKKMDFGSIFRINASATLVSGGLAIGMALTDWGVYSLVWKLIVGTLMTCLVLWFRGSWRPGLNWSRDSLRSIMGFSLPLLGNQSLNYWVRNIDNLLIGKYIGDAALGFYNQSYRIMLIPVRQISGVMSGVLFPSLSEIQDDKERIKAIYLKTTRLLSFITFPLMFGLCALAEPFVQVLLGEKWLPMVPVLQYLSIVAAFQSIGTLNGNIFQATGKTTYQLIVGLPPRMLYILAILLGLRYGIEGVAWNYMLAVIFSSFYMYFFVGRIISASLIEIIKSLSTNFLLSGLMAIIVHLLYVEMYKYTESKFLLLLVSSLIAVVVYGGLCYVFNRVSVNDFRSTIKSVVNVK